MYLYWAVLHVLAIFISIMVHVYQVVLEVAADLHVLPISSLIQLHMLIQFQVHVYRYVLSKLTEVALATTLLSNVLMFVQSTTMPQMLPVDVSCV